MSSTLIAGRRLRLTAPRHAHGSRCDPKSSSSPASSPRASSPRSSPTGSASLSLSVLSTHSRRCDAWLRPSSTHRRVAPALYTRASDPSASMRRSSVTARVAALCWHVHTAVGASQPSLITTTPSASSPARRQMRAPRSLRQKASSRSFSRAAPRRFLGVWPPI